AVVLGIGEVLVGFVREDLWQLFAAMAVAGLGVGTVFAALPGLKLAAKAAKRRVELEKATVKARKEAGKRTAATVTSVKRSVGIEKQPRRWPWVVAVLAVVGAAVFALLRRKSSDDLWTPAPTGDGPVPSYREDPVPMSAQTPAGGSETPEAQGKQVSTAMTAPSDSGPAEGGIGALEAEPASGPGEPGNQDRPTTATGTTNDPDSPVASAANQDYTEGPGSAGNSAPSRGTRPDEDAAG
ncbi:hypothetical protein DMO24_21745, partial [Modestobacter versicolor]